MSLSLSLDECGSNEATYSSSGVVWGKKSTGNVKKNGKRSSCQKNTKNEKKGKKVKHTMGKKTA